MEAGNRSRAEESSGSTGTGSVPIGTSGGVTRWSGSGGGAFESGTCHCGWSGVVDVLAESCERDAHAGPQLTLLRIAEHIEQLSGAPLTGHPVALFATGVVGAVESPRQFVGRRVDAAVDVPCGDRRLDCRFARGHEVRDQVDQTLALATVPPQVGRRAFGERPVSRRC